MWWNGSEWGHMHGWWFMPIFGLVCMVIFIYVIGRIFGSSGGFCGRPFTGIDHNEINELRKEIHDLREELRALRENKDS